MSALRAARGLRGLGMASSESYALAKQVVDALAINDYWSAVALLGGMSSTEIAEVAKKAIALGAAPETVNQLVQQLGKTEVIEVVDTKPTVALARPWWHYALGAAAVGTVAYSVYKLRRELW